MQKSKASKTDLRSYFKRKAEESKPASKKVKPASPEIIVSASENVNPAEIEIAKDEVKMSLRAEHYAIISENIRKDVGKYAMVNGTNAAIKKFAKLYPKFTFKRTTIDLFTDSDAIFEKSIPQCIMGYPGYMCIRREVNKL